MHFVALLSSALAVVSTASALAPDRTLPEDADLMPRQTPMGRCSKGVHVIAAPGAGHPPGDPYSLIGSLANKVKKAIPGSSHALLMYDRPNADQAYAIEAGSRLLRKYIRQYHAACRKTQIVLLGYSSGAIITMNALCGASEYPYNSPAQPFPSFWNETILATVVYGDETFVSGQPWDHGTCRYHGISPRTHNAGCKAFAAGMHSYCDKNDPQCCQGHVYESHFRYPKKYDDNALQFIVARYNKSQRAN